MISSVGLLLAITGVQDSGPPVVFEHVAVVISDSGVVRANQTVLIRNGRIARIGPTGSFTPPSDGMRIEGRGRFLLPGLADLHVHITARDFPLFLINGVTSVREMNGSPAHLAWRDSLATGAMQGPALYVTSPLLAGEPQRYRHELLSSPEDAVAAVRRARTLGFDGLKVYDGLRREVYQALAAEAGRVGLPLTGHVPAAVGLGGLAPQQRTVEHTQEVLRGLDLHRPDSLAIARNVALLAGRGIAVVPTLAVFERLSLAATPEVQALFARPEMAYVDSSIAAWWSGFRRAAPAAANSRARALADAHRLVVRLLQSQGIPILVGTDTPNPFMVPGYSLHDELDALHRAGLSRAELLRAATAGAADFLGAGAEVGRMQPGLRADLILVEGNPLEDLAPLRRPVGVMVRGRWYLRADLASKLPGREP